MTDNEIVQALECCIHQQLCAFDDGKCSYFDKSYVGRQLVIQNAYDLIKRQHAEIYELQCRNLELERENDELQTAIKNVYEEGLRLNNSFFGFVEKNKYEAVKEFAKKVKLDFHYEFDELITIMAEKIDKRVKEMEGK